MNSNLHSFLSHDRAEAERAINSGNPLLVHVHIPKCAGTSFNHLLDRSFASQHVPMYSPQPSACFSTAEFAERLAAAPDALAVSSHSIRLFPRRVGHRVPLYVLFLRDPLEWVVSNMTYLIQNYHRLSEAHRATLPLTCAEMSVKELLLWLRERNLRESRPQFDVLRYLTAPTVEAHFTSLEENDLITLGKHLLDRFFFVGIVEQMPRSLHMLREKLRAAGLDLSTEDMPLLNTSSQSRGDLGWLTENDPVGQRVLSRLARDRILYQHVVESLR